MRIVVFVLLQLTTLIICLKHAAPGTEVTDPISDLIGYGFVSWVIYRLIDHGIQHIHFIKVTERK